MWNNVLYGAGLTGKLREMNQKNGKIIRGSRNIGGAFIKTTDAWNILEILFT